MPRHAAASTRSTKRVIPVARSANSDGSGRPDLCPITHDRARHASWAAPATAQLAARDADDLDAGGLEPAVGLDVALVGDTQPRRECEGVVAVVPLLAF